MPDNADTAAEYGRRLNDYEWEMEAHVDWGCGCVLGWTDPKCLWVRAELEAGTDEDWDTLNYRGEQTVFKDIPDARAPGFEHLDQEHGGRPVEHWYDGLSLQQSHERLHETTTCNHSHDVQHNDGDAP